MSSNTNDTNTTQYREGIVLQGYHKKLKTMKKKYFVLCAENGNCLARLEYYDNEKKFKSRANPKRTILLKNCFNINRRLDTKYKYVIALSTKEEGFCMVLDSEQELNTWLRSLLALQRGEETESDPPKPNFEHVWQVQVQRKGIAEERGVIGNYYVCLTTKSISLARIGSPTTNLGEHRLSSIEFYLTTIRRCGDSQCFFYIEIGRNSPIGAGELWMETEDSLIAQNMHTMILNAMSACVKIKDDNFGPMRKRSSSANEASKPISVLQRRQTHSGNKHFNSSPLNEDPSAASSTVSSTCTVINTQNFKPSSNKTQDLLQNQFAITNISSSFINQQYDSNQQSALSTSNCCSTTRVTPVITSTSYNPQYPFTAPLRALGSQRRHSVSVVPALCHHRALSLPNGDHFLNINCCKTIITNNTMNTSIRLLNNLHRLNITNNNEVKLDNNIGFIHPVHQRTRSYPLTEEMNHITTKGATKQIFSLGTNIGRERCDSLPSRNRTSSEQSNQSVGVCSMPPPKTVSVITNRPHSMYNNRQSHSPPINALSPSTGCSESDGSSLSIDETDSFGHSLTPDESGNFVVRYYNSRTSGNVIPEENCDDFWYSDNKHNLNEGTSLDKLNNQHHHVALSLPISTYHNAYRKGSPAMQMGSTETQSQYMDMYSPYSPCGSSPCDQTGSGYIPISPGVDFSRGAYTGSSGGHSRASSLAEETVDGYVPMCPSQPQDYVDMVQSSRYNNLSSMSSAASSCSVTSGTPSTDLRFAEYPLDKVKSRFTPDDEEITSTSERPIRAYSVGSRLEHNKRKFRIDILNAEQNSSRVRALSVGSRAKVPRSDLYRGAFAPNIITCHNNNNNNSNNNNNIEYINPAGKGKKSSSAPLLAHKSQNSVDRMSDLMEIDFSKNLKQNEKHTSSFPIKISSFPVSVPNVRHKYDMFSISPKSSSNNGYVEMKPGSLPETVTKKTDGYLEMRPIGLSKSSSLSGSSNQSATSSELCNQLISNSNINNNKSNYINISPSNEHLNSTQKKNISNGSLSNSPSDKAFIGINKIKSDIKENGAFTSVEGYVEMSWKNSKTAKKLATKSNNLCNNIINKKNEENKKKSPENKFYNMPTIKNQNTKMSSNDNVLHPTSPPILIPFNLNKVTKISQNEFAQRKCMVDATKGRITISSDKSKLCNLADTDTLNKIQNTDNIPLTQITNVEKMEALSNDYASMTLNTKQDQNINLIKENNNYVNYSPNEIKTADNVQKQINVLKTEIPSDYTIMNPQQTDKNVTNKKRLRIKLESVTTLNKDISYDGFKSIANTDDIFIKKSNCNNNKKLSSPRSKISRQTNDKLNIDDNSGYELLQMRSDSSLQNKRIISRPNSVNSEKIIPSKSCCRPNSANSECIPSISTSTSASTLCGESSSSSSTLCGSKSQSPLTNSRPQSFTDTTTTISTRPDSGNLTSDQNISSRPPSVSSERELHYASLDLPPSSSSNIFNLNETNQQIPNMLPLAKANSSSSGESSTSPSPNINTSEQQQTFTYVQIDFNKSESLKSSLNTSNNKQ